MITWDDALLTCQDIGNDATASTATFFKRMMNVGYKQILADLGRSVGERTKTISTRAPSSPLVDADRLYNFPSDYQFLKSMVYQIGAQKYPLVEAPSQEIWDYQTRILSSGVTSTFFIREDFGVGGAKFLLDPIPAAINSLTYVYEATDRDLAQAAVTVGTALFTLNSTAVVGIGTAWASAMIGRYIKATDATGNGLYYRISAVADTTHLTLENTYDDTTTASVAYTINEIFALPEEMQILPSYFALQHFFASKKDVQQEQKYMAYYMAGVQAGKDRWATKSRNNTIRNRTIRRGHNYPIFFPQGGIAS